MDEAGLLAKAIGDKLRHARTERRMTLNELSAHTGLSQAFLSRLERGRVSSSIANLLQITGALGVPLRELFADGGADDRGFTVYHAADGPQPTTLPATGYAWQPVSMGRNGAHGLQAFLVTFPLNNRWDVLVSHEGEELIYVVEGEVVFHVGEDCVRLRRGDGIHLRSDIPHMAENVGTIEAKVLMVTAGGRAGGAAFDWWNVRGPAADVAAPRRNHRA